MFGAISCLPLGEGGPSQRWMRSYPFYTQRTDKSPFIEPFLMPRSVFDLGSDFGKAECRRSTPVANVVREDFDEVECLSRRVLPARL